MIKPTAILTSDWHLREDTPTCFIGDWNQEQWKAVEQVRALQAEHDCPVIHAGDLFDNWKPSPGLISQALYFLPEQFYTIYGQHDLPQHSWELRSKSGLHTLEVADKIKVLKECHWGQSPKKGSLFFPNREVDRTILVWHYMTYLKSPYPGASKGMAEGLLRKYPQFDLIVTGDNHQSFTIEYEGRLLVNPGNLTRQEADQIDFKPRVYLWDADTNTVEPVYLNVMDDVISREHLIVRDKRNARIDAFISKFDSDWEIGTSFEDNLELFKSTNQVRSSVMDIVYKATEL